MSYIEKAKQNQANAQKADAWNKMQEEMRIREEIERAAAEKEQARAQRLVSEFAPTQREYEIQMQADQMARDMGRPISESDYATAARNYQPDNPRVFTPQELNQHKMDNEALYQANKPRGSVNEVLQQRTQEPESSWWSDTVNRIKNFDFLTNQSKEQQAEYTQMGQEMRQQMEDDAIQAAIDKAGSMGDRSEENINRLIQEELKRKGL
jgi:hypothetical protein